MISRRRRHAIRIGAARVRARAAAALRHEARVGVALALSSPPAALGGCRIGAVHRPVLPVEARAAALVRNRARVGDALPLLDAHLAGGWVGLGRAGVLAKAVNVATGVAAALAHQPRVPLAFSRPRPSLAIGKGVDAREL